MAFVRHLILATVKETNVEPRSPCMLSGHALSMEPQLNPGSAFHCLIGTVDASDKSRRDFPAGWEEGIKLLQGWEELLRTSIPPTPTPVLLSPGRRLRVMDGC